MVRLPHSPVSANVVRKAAGLAVILFAYGAVFLANYHLRDIPIFPHPNPFRPQELIPLVFDQNVIGFFLQITILPLLILSMLSYLPHVRRLLQDQTTPHATPLVFLGLAVVQVIAQTYEIWLSRATNHPYFLGTFVILIGSLIGGWRVGLPLGGISLVYQSGFEHLAMSSMLPDIRAAGLAQYLAVFRWGQFFWEGVFNPHFSCGVWTAVFASLGAGSLGSRRYSPWAAAVLGVILEFGMGDLRYAAGIVPGLEGIPAQALVTGFSAAWVMLMIRTIQVEASRRKAAEADLARMEAELRALRAQINPHFFFNALNTIRYMIRTDPAKARQLLIDLSEVFQRTLRSGDFVPLRDELGSVQAYLSLEKARLGERLRVEWGGALQPENPLDTQSFLLEQAVPTLALQPIVENAVIHGIGKKPEGGTVLITVDRRRDDLVIRVEDDGLGMEPEDLAKWNGAEGAQSTSIGLKNVNGRLRLLYGPDYGLTVDSAPGSGTRVTIRIPVGERRSANPIRLPGKEPSRLSESDPPTRPTRQVGGAGTRRKRKRD